MCRTYTAITSRLPGKPSEHRVSIAMLILPVFTVGVSLVKPKLSFETFCEKREILIHVEVCIDSMLMIPLLSNSVDVLSGHSLASFDVSITNHRH